MCLKKLHMCRKPSTILAISSSLTCICHKPPAIQQVSVSDVAKPSDLMPISQYQWQKVAISASDSDSKRLLMLV